LLLTAIALGLRCRLCFNGEITPTATERTVKRNDVIKDICAMEDHILLRR
jgi:hypothetical protein